MKTFPLNLTDEAKARYKSAAHREEKNLSEWMREKLDAACEALGIAVGQKAAPPSMFRKKELPPHHDEIMAILKGAAKAAYCKEQGIPNPDEEGAKATFWSAPPPPIVDESESKADRREREMLERHGEA